MIKKFFIFSAVCLVGVLSLAPIGSEKDTEKTEEAPIVKPQTDPEFEIQKACRDNIYVIKAAGIYEGIKNKQWSNYEVSELGDNWFVKIDGVLVDNGVEWVSGSMVCKVKRESLRTVYIALHGEVLFSEG